MNNTHSYLPDQRNQKILININGKMYIREDAKISVFDSGFLLGDGVWEGVRLHNQHLVFIEEHLDRLYNGLNAIEIDIQYSKNELRKMIETTVKENRMQTNVHIRLIITRGLKSTPYQHPSANVGSPHIVIIPEYKEPNKKIYSKGINLVSVSTKRSVPEIQNPQINSLSKFNCIQACIEAKNKGGDEGLMQDINGNISTCNSTNFFMVKNNEIWTSRGQYCLNGITRGKIIEICQENNIKILEKNFTIEEAYSCKEAFVTGTFSGVIPVHKIDDYIIDDNSKTKILHQLYKQKIETLYPQVNNE